MSTTLQNPFTAYDKCITQIRPSLLRKQAKEECKFISHLEVIKIIFFKALVIEKKMPYTGPQAVACYAKASACLKAGRSPTWACEDEWKTKYPIKSKERVMIRSGKYNTECGPLLVGNKYDSCPFCGFHVHYFN
jgi:hypothetical protein